MFLRNFVFVFSLLHCSFLEAQVSFVWEHENQNVLYRGYENHIFLTEKTKNSLIVLSNNSTVLNDFISNTFFVRPPVEANKITIFIVDSLTKDTLLSKIIDVISLPDPTIYFGKQEGDPGCGGVPIYVNYEKTSKLKVDFQILRYELQINNSRSSTGSGNLLSSDAIFLLKSCKPDSQIHFTVTVLGSDNIRRVINQSFTI